MDKIEKGVWIIYDPTLNEKIRRLTFGKNKNHSKFEYFPTTYHFIKWMERKA